MNDIDRIAQQGLAALQAGDAATARTAFDTVAAAGRASPRLYLLLAEACRALGDTVAQDAAASAVIDIEPRNLPAMAMKGDLSAAAGDLRAASAWYAMVVSSAAGQNLPPELARVATYAQARLTETQADFAAHLDASLSGVDAGPRFDEAVALLKGQAEPQLQQPTSFFYPGLAQTAFFARDDFGWVADLEAATSDIRRECDAVLASGIGLKPYVEADPTRPNKRHALLGNADWSAFHLMEEGRPAAGNAERCPATMAALDRLPLPRIAERAPMALFSILKPHTHIPPHWGMLNTRLIVHLPLIVPDGCRLRVGNHIQPVVAGKTMIFDDSIEHEAWNDSDAIRVVLLFEIWRPDIADAERAALTRMFDAISSYGAASD